MVTVIVLGVSYPRVMQCKSVCRGRQRCTEKIG